MAMVYTSSQLLSFEEFFGWCSLYWTTEAADGYGLSASGRGL